MLLSDEDAGYEQNAEP